MIGKHILSLFLLSISCVNATNFTIALKSCKGDTDVVTLDSVSITCDGSEYCTLGSEAEVSGAFTIQYELESSVADVKAKYFGYKKEYDDVDICSFAGEALEEGVSCPGAGTYSFNIPVTLPEVVKDKWYTKFLDKTYGKKEVEFDFDEIGADVKCKFYIFTEGSTEKEKKGKKKKKSSDDEYVTSAAALLFVGAAAAFGINRRRRIATGSGSLLGDEIGSNFEMMGNKNNAVV
jgi:hypothetical protein